MKTLDRFISISILAALVLIAAPVASAQEAEDDSNWRRPPWARQFNRGFGRQGQNSERRDEWRQQRQDRRAELEEKCGDRQDEANHECYRAEREARHAERKAKREEIRNYVQDQCGEPGSDGFHECRRGLRDEIKEKYPELGNMRGRHGRGKLRGRMHHKVQEECGEPDSDGFEECRENLKNEFKENHPNFGQRRERRRNIISSIRTCRDENPSDFQGFKSCIQNIIDTQNEEE